MSAITAIRKRRSIRTYLPKPVEPEKISELRDFLAGNKEGPFGSSVRFALLDLSTEEGSPLAVRGTYGVIQGAIWFIAGTVEPSSHAMEDFGFCMEKNIIKATNMGLATCWLGITFNRIDFIELMKLHRNTLLPAVTPIGYARGKRSLVDGVFRFFAGSQYRKPWNRLFFNSDFSRPLARNEARRFELPLECVRIAPSARNRQPWAIIMDGECSSFHFYMEKSLVQESWYPGISMSRVDMGIALSHFDLSTKELGIEGRWNLSEPDIDSANHIYIATWQPSEIK